MAQLDTEELGTALCNPVDCSARLPCPSPSPGARSDSCPLSQWCHAAILSSVVPFSCLQSFPASGSFPMSWIFTSGGQSIRASASASVLPMNIQDWFPLGWTGWISLQSKGFSRVFSSTTVWKHQFFSAQFSLWSICQVHTCYWKNHSFDYSQRCIHTFVNKVMSLLFNMQSRFIIAFLPRSKHLFISWLKSPSTLILEPNNMKSDTVSTFSHPLAMKWGTGCHDLHFFECWVLTIFH